MIILIDAYNVIKTVYRAAHVAPGDIEQFISLLNTYAKKSGHRLHVVFDGFGPESMRVAPHASVTLHYSGHTKRPMIYSSSSCIRIKIMIVYWCHRIENSGIMLQPRQWSQQWSQ